MWQKSFFNPGNKTLNISTKSIKKKLYQKMENLIPNIPTKLPLHAGSDYYKENFSTELK